MSVRDNLTLANLRRFARLFTIRDALERAEARRMIERLTIKVSSPEVEVTALSGETSRRS